MQAMKRYFYKLSNILLRKILKGKWYGTMDSSMVSVYSFPRLNVHTHIHSYKYKVYVNMCMWEKHVAYTIRVMSSWYKFLKPAKTSGYGMKSADKIEKSRLEYELRDDLGNIANVCSEPGSVVLHQSYYACFRFRQPRVCICLLPWRVFGAGQV